MLKRVSFTQNERKKKLGKDNMLQHVKKIILLTIYHLLSLQTELSCQRSPNRNLDKSFLLKSIKLSEKIEQ